jgi:hypothetical protein
VNGFGLARGATCSVAFGFACLFVRVGIATASAFHPIQFPGGGEVAALVTAGQLPADLEVSDHSNDLLHDEVFIRQLGRGGVRLPRAQKNPSAGLGWEQEK